MVRYNHGTGTLVIEQDGTRVQVDGRNSTINAEVPRNTEDFTLTDNLYGNPVKLMDDAKQQNEQVLPSFDLIRFQKVKPFIDGVYAVVEQDYIGSQGTDISRLDVLSRLSKDLQGNPSGKVHDEALAYVATASSFTNQSIRTSRIIAGLVKRNRKMFDQTSYLSLPLGFYDWTPQLQNLYRQIKFLSQPPHFYANSNDENFDADVMDILRKGVRGNSELAALFDRVIGAYDELTNKGENDNSLFPSAIIPDQNLFVAESIETQSDLEEGLGKVLVRAIRERKIDFTPKEDSGLYIRQMWELVPLVLRDTPEFQKYIPDKRYIKMLEESFIAQWVATRNTHVGHTDFGMSIGAAMPHRQPIVIRPELQVEPFAESYRRMQASLTFLRDSVGALVSRGVFDTSRLLYDGSRGTRSIGEEFESLHDLLYGLELLSMDGIHQPYSNGNAAKIKVAQKWLSSLREDPDINRDSRLIVPIIRTTGGDRYIVYVIPGFKPVKVELSYGEKPKVDIKDTESRRGYGFFDTPDIKFDSSEYLLPALQYQEMRIPLGKLMTSASLRQRLGKTLIPQNELKRFKQEMER